MLEGQEVKVRCTVEAYPCCDSWCIMVKESLYGKSFRFLVLTQICMKNIHHDRSQFDSLHIAKKGCRYKILLLEGFMYYEEGDGHFLIRIRYELGHAEKGP